jgi:hypothetical protein
VQPHFLLGLDRLVRQLAEMTLTLTVPSAQTKISIFIKIAYQCAYLEGTMMTISIIVDSYGSYHNSKAHNVTMNNLIKITTNYAT